MITTRSVPALLPVAAALVAALGPVRAQTVRYESPENGFRVLVHRELESVPTEPNERQILMKWGGKIALKDKRFRGNEDCTVMIVRIAKNKGPTTGDGPKTGDDDTTLREDLIARLNSGTTIEQFLDKRGYKHDLREVTDEKPIKTKNGDVLVAKQLMGDTFDENRWEYKQLPLIRSYAIEDQNEIFAVISIGPFVEPFDEMVMALCKSLERTATGAAKESKDYTTAGLDNVGFREQVRSKLVKGWEAYDTEHFILVTNARNKSLIDKMLVDLELMRQVYTERFPPVADISNVISTVRFCETYDDYMAYGAPDGTAGYWDFTSEELVLVDIQTLDKKILDRNPNLRNIQVLDVMYHEAMHQYFFYCNGNLAPASWFNEGFGEVFGGANPDRRKNEIKSIDKNKFRMAWIKRYQRASSWPDLRVMLKQSQGEFYGGNIMNNYAFAWSFCYFCEEHRKDPRGNKEYGAIPDTYLKNLREATDAVLKEKGIDRKDVKGLTAYTIEIQKQAFEKTFGDMDLLKLEKDWIDAIKKWR